MRSGPSVERRTKPALRALPILLVGAAIACALRSPPLSDDERRDREFAPASGMAAIYVVRGGFVGHREYMLPLVGGRVLGGLLPGTYLRIDVDPGRHLLYGSFAAIDRSPPLEVTVSAGDVLFARVVRSSSVPPSVGIQRVESRRGRRAVLRSRSGLVFPSAPARPARAHAEVARAFEPPEGRGLVYVLRMGMTRRASGASAHGDDPDRSRKVVLIIDGHAVAVLPKRSYSAFEVDPGTHSVVGAVFTTHVLEPLELEVEGGRSYFLEVSDDGDRQEGAVPIALLSEGQWTARARPGQVRWLE